MPFKQLQKIKLLPTPPPSSSFQLLIGRAYRPIPCTGGSI